VIKNRIALSAILLFLLVVLCLVGLGCPPVYYTKEYQPISEWEQREFNKADRKIYPDDVRQNIVVYESKTVAWAGLIQETHVIQTDEGPDVVYLLEHHYFDWLEDYGPQRERLFLSPRGEGVFKTTWGLKKDTTAAELDDFTNPDHMLIVYGTPLSIEQDVIVLNASYIRGIDRRYYTTEKMDYGR
jgi:hypothetical protein